MNKSMQDLHYNYHFRGNEDEFSRYKEGDTVTVTGEISAKYGGKDDFPYEYQYELDDYTTGPWLNSERDIGEEGDRITVTMEIVDMNGIEVLEIQNCYNPSLKTPTSQIGLILLGVGGVIVTVGFVKGRKEKAEKPN
ncbi:MAG: hypothetical protein R6U61_04205 [Thermoplasmata archaeon]